MLKIIEAIKTSGNNPMTNIVYGDGFILGGWEKDKIRRSHKTKKKESVTTVELTEDGRSWKEWKPWEWKNFLTNCLQYICVNQICRKGQVITDKLRGYRPIAKAYNINQIKVIKEWVFC